MFRLAVTGGIACGKSLVGRILSREGVSVCEADRLAHELMVPGTVVYRGVLDAFGGGILGPEGEVDRSVLGKRVFSDPASLRRLNRLVHPHVVSAWRAWLDTVDSDRPAAVIVPLLYEIGVERGWDAVLCVASAETVQRRRLAQRGLTEAEIDQRLAAQMPLMEKMLKADFVVVNDGSEDLLNRQTVRVLRRLMENAA